MQIRKYNNREEWLDARLGKITGTRVKDLIMKRATKPKKGFWEILAERVAVPHDGENVMDRGIRLEEEAIARFVAATDKNVNTDLVIWEHDDDPNIAISPDGYIEPKKGKPITEAVEAKCLNSASHCEAYITKQIPDEYEYQVIQYFVVNPDLQTLYFLFYDPRMPEDFFFVTVERKDKEVEIAECIAAEKEALEKLTQYEELLTF
jgi:YqaJ-like viral recombinase domain